MVPLNMLVLLQGHANWPSSRFPMYFLNSFSRYHFVEFEVHTRPRKLPNYRNDDMGIRGQFLRQFALLGTRASKPSTYKVAHAFCWRFPSCKRARTSCSPCSYLRTGSSLSGTTSLRFFNIEILHLYHHHPHTPAVVHREPTAREVSSSKEENVRPAHPKRFHSSSHF